MQVQYSITEFPISNLTSFEFIHQQDWSPENIGEESDGTSDTLLSPVIMYLEIKPIEPNSMQVRAKDFTIAGLNPNFTQVSECENCDNESFVGSLSEIEYRQWDSLAETTNIIGNPAVVALHPWVQRVTMVDEGPTEENGYINKIKVYAELKNNIEVPPYDYNIVLDIDGDAVVLPPIFVGSSFKITCNIVGPNNTTPCSKVFAVIPQCFNFWNNGWVMEPVLPPVSPFQASVMVTYYGDDPEASIAYDSSCGQLQGQGGNASLSSFFAITPTAGHTLSRFNVFLGQNMYAPIGSSGYGFTENDYINNNYNPKFTNTSAEVDSLEAWYIYDVDGSLLDPSEDRGITVHENFFVNLTYFQLEQSDTGYWYEGNNTTQIPYHWDNACSSCSPPQTFELNLDTYDGRFYLLDTNTNALSQEFLDYYLQGAQTLEVNQQTPSTSPHQLALQNPTEFNENNVIAIIDTIDAYTPGENPPDIQFTLEVDNCNMDDWNDFDEDEWFYFNEISIYTNDNEDGEIDVIITGEGSFDIDWGEDE